MEGKVKPGLIMMELLVFNDIGPQTAGPVVSPLTEVLLTAQWWWSVSRLAAQAGFYRAEEISEITERELEQ